MFAGRRQATRWKNAVVMCKFPVPGQAMEALGVGDFAGGGGVIVTLRVVIMAWPDRVE